MVIVVGLALVGLTARYVQARFLLGPAEPTHLAQKERYLASLPEVSPTAPSFVVIFFDDLGYGDLSSYGNRLIDTPAIDLAAEEGLRMTSFYSASSVCTPSRAALLTGRYPPRTLTDRHVYFPDDSLIGTGRRMLGWANELPRDEITLAEALGEAGYATAMVGKWHLGGRPGHHPVDFGFQSWFGVLYSNDMVPLDLYRGREVIHEDLRSPGLFGSGERDEARPLGPGGIDQRELTERYTDESIAFLEANRERPFFLYLAHTFPHVPHYASKGHAGESEGGVYGDVVEDLDRSTGAILAALDRLGLAETTAVFITSDNGADYNGSPGPLRGRKGEILEGGQRVPMIVRWPGRVAARSESHEPAMNTDLFPTLLSLAGLPLPTDREIDGRDLTALLEGRAGSPHEPLYFFPVLDSLPGAVRSGPFKYLRSTGDLGRDRSHLSRVDRDEEGHELSKLHPEEAVRLEAALEEMRSQVEANPRGWLP
ncbi:MAG: sulfatase [Deltaproteobacteria bacterium]|nr:sulfatase [Deltaproteobacteria bacterium]MBW2446007.1 sulfatase [Deltaproteobacteria bacterium]